MSGIRLSLSRAVAASSVVLAASLALTGCSSSSSGGTTGGSGAGSSTAASSSSAASAPASSSSAPTKASGGGVGGGSDFCHEAVAAQAAQAKAAGAYSGGSPASLQKIEQQAITELRVLTATAPSAIKSDFGYIASVSEKIYAALQAAHFDVRKLDPSTLTAVNTPEFTKASTAIEGYLRTTCGISTSPSA